MASTDADGSPILILRREHAEAIADFASCCQFVCWDFTSQQHDLLEKIRETFPDLGVPDYS